MNTRSEKGVSGQPTCIVIRGAKQAPQVEEPNEQAAQVEETLNETREVVVWLEVLSTTNL